MKKIIILLILFQSFILKAQEGSVVCVHGFFRSYKCMIPVGNTLRDEGFSVFMMNYKSRYKRIEEHAENLVQILNSIAAERPGEPIHFVTHSLGGIIVRAALNHPNCPEEAKFGKAILYAPPNQGSCLARTFQGCPCIRWFFGKGAGSQLLTYTDEDMASIGSFPPSMDVMVIAGTKESPLFRKWVKEPNDGKVTIEETRLQTPHKHCTVDVNHTWIMTRRETLQLTKEFLLQEDSN